MNMQDEWENDISIINAILKDIDTCTLDFENL